MFSSNGSLWLVAVYAILMVVLQDPLISSVKASRIIPSNEPNLWMARQSAGGEDGVVGQYSGKALIKRRSSGDYCASLGAYKTFFLKLYLRCSKETIPKKRAAVLCVLNVISAFSMSTPF